MASPFSTDFNGASDDFINDHDEWRQNDASQDKYKKYSRNAFY